MKGVYVITFEGGSASKKEIRKALRAAGLRGISVIDGRKAKSIDVDIPQPDGSDLCSKYRIVGGCVEINTFIRPAHVAHQAGD